ncbi:hypothetical protein EVAR_30595_1 [Eumeta japonica]|uniref:Uncharacterized protein n=1 Tax=Eumeta variegata TaxID=151549 RepID=A0A4C1WBH8_EUMVA|nr:hypothetical protein EVAR_30595_1 [Eumeta japonica]
MNARIAPPERCGRRRPAAPAPGGRRRRGVDTYDKFCPAITLTEYEREVTAFTVVFRPASDSYGDLLPPLTFHQPVPLSLDILFPFKKPATDSPRVAAGLNEKNNIEGTTKERISTTTMCIYTESAGKKVQGVIAPCQNTLILYLPERWKKIYKGDDRTLRKSVPMYGRLYLIPTQEVGNELVTSPETQVSMGGDDHMCSAGSHAHLPPDNAIKKKFQTAVGLPWIFERH